MSELFGRKVPAEGPKDAKIVLLGESPGGMEERNGRPFIGPAGKLLNELLVGSGLRREDIYITNTVKYNPDNFPVSKDKLFFSDGSPTKFYMDGIVELVGELREVNPNVIVPMGNYALWALTQESGIMKWRGSILESSLVPGLKVIPTIHPAYFLNSQQWHQFALVEWDFQRIAGDSQYPELRRPDAEFIINPTADQIQDATNRLLSAERITIDTEWYSPENLAYIGFSDGPEWAICIAPSSMQAYRAYKTILSSEVPKVMQNAMFDVVALARMGLEVRNLEHDTMVAWNACWGDVRKKGLDIIGSVLTRWPYYKEDLEFVGSGEDPDRGQIYNCTDCVVTHTAMDALLNEEFEITGAKPGYDISMGLFDIFAESTKVGIRADVQKMDEMKAMYLERASENEAWLNEKVGYTINVRSWQQVKELVYGDLGISRKKQTTAQDVLMDIAAALSDKDDRKEILTRLIRIRQDLNMVSRYFRKEEIVDKDGRIRCNWNLAGTRSGRLSTTKPWWNGVPLQTTPDEARAYLIPDKGNVFIGWDLGQAEARVVAVLTNDFELLEDMQSGVDIHVKLAAQLPFGLTYEELMALCSEKGKDNVDERFLAKKTRHGMNYILTHVGLKRSVNREYLDTGVGINTAMAKTLRNGYLEASPGLEGWWEEVLHKLREDRTLVNCFGRSRIFLGKLYAESDTHKEAVSFEPQSTIADLTSISIQRIKHRAPWAIVHTHMHDGGLIEVPEERREQAVQIVKQETQREIIVRRRPLVIPSDVKVGYNYLEMKYV